MVPLLRREGGDAVNLSGPIAGDRSGQKRGAAHALPKANLHDPGIPAIRILVAPTHELAPLIDLSGAKPELTRGGRVEARRKIVDVGHTDPAGAQVPRRAADHRIRRSRAVIDRRGEAGGVQHVPVHVHHATIAVGGVKDRRAAGLAAGGWIAPIHDELLVRVAPDTGQQHPDGGRLLDGIPLLDLVGQPRAGGGGEPDVCAGALRLAEVEGSGVEPQQYGEVGLQG